MESLTNGLCHSARSWKAWNHTFALVCPFGKTRENRCSFCGVLAAHGCSNRLPQISSLKILTHALGVLEAGGLVLRNLSEAVFFLGPLWVGVSFFFPLLLLHWISCIPNLTISLFLHFQGPAVQTVSEDQTRRPKGQELLGLWSEF